MRAVLAAAASMFLTTVPAYASGRLPPLPITPQAFHDFGACRAFLEDTYRQDTSRADPNPVAIEGGSTRQTLIESKGPITLDPSHARYEVTEGWQVRHLHLRRAMSKSPIPTGQQQWRAQAAH
jgi:hypothetical protein